MFQANYITRPLQFKRPAGTSRGVLHRKPCWYLQITASNGLSGIGEVSFIPGLSVEDPGEMVMNLDRICTLINKGGMDSRGLHLQESFRQMPGVQFALETAIKDLEGGGKRILYPSGFTAGTEGISTNGLIWMGDRAFMIWQIREKIEQGFRVLKMKVGALELQEELDLLHWIRSAYGKKELEIRLDANGAWEPEEAAVRMDQFARFGIHSIEQPIAPGQPEALVRLCNNPAIPVALDEELIGMGGETERYRLLEQVRPAYIILKPGLLGGFSVAESWIGMAEKLGTGWWVTSALESSVGLNAIAQWTYQLGITMPQGLGTGQLYRNNIPSPLEMKGELLMYRPEIPWKLPFPGAAPPEKLTPVET